MSLPTLEQDGFFEGVYDHDFNFRRELSPEQVNQHMPYRGRWDLQHAQPLIFEFPDGVEQHLGKLSLPYRQTNQLVQIGLQYHLHTQNRQPVPDGYMVRYSRLGQFAGADIEKSLTVAVLRADTAEELVDADLTNGYDTDRYWQQTAKVAQKFGNALLAFSVSRHSYKRLIGATGKQTHSPMQPADEKLAQAAFETVAFWES